MKCRFCRILHDISEADTFVQPLVYQCEKTFPIPYNLGMHQPWMRYSFRCYYQLTRDTVRVMIMHFPDCLRNIQMIKSRTASSWSKRRREGCALCLPSRLIHKQSLETEEDYVKVKARKTAATKSQSSSDAGWTRS